jgi:predicted HTH transcriptional regulator
LHRIGSTKRKLSTEQLARLMQSRNRAGLVWFDEMPVHDCHFEDLSEPLWHRLLGGGVDADRIKLAKMKILTRDEDEQLASVAGCLMCADQPVRWLRNAYVQCVRYLETQRTADQQHDAVDFNGPADDQIIGATRFVLRNMHTGARKDIGREDFPQYSPAAVFEGIANAVAHRDYSQPGSCIRVHQFSDRLEIDSPGALANSQTVETLAYKQATRNELLVSLLARCPVDIPGVNRRTVLDKRGEGVPLLLSLSEELSGRRPTYELVGGDYLKLTIYAAQTPRGVREGINPYN